MPTPAQEHTNNRLLVVADAQDIYVEAAVCFAELDFPVDRTRSFDTAGVLLAHLAYSAVLVHFGGDVDESHAQLWRLQALLQCAKGTPVVLLTTTPLPEPAAQIIRGVSLYFDRRTPLPEIAEAVRSLVHSVSERMDCQHDGTYTSGACRPPRHVAKTGAPRHDGPAS